MASNGENNLRTLASVVSVDGWIADFDDNELATVHVDIVFSESSFGADPLDKVRFRMRLKRAELILHIPDGEPITIRRETIARTIVDECTTITTTTETALAAQGRTAVNATVSPSPTIGMSAEASADASTSLRMQSNSSRSQGRFQIQHFSDSGRYGWRIAATDGKPMDGAPWDPVASPRMTVKRSQKRNAEGNRPSMKVEIKCRREDIEIIDLELKDPGLSDKLIAKVHKDRHIAAAEQLIKRQIEREGFLKSPDMTNPDAIVMIADMLIMEQE